MEFILSVDNQIEVDFDLNNPDDQRVYNIMTKIPAILRKRKKGKTPISQMDILKSAGIFSSNKADYWSVPEGDESCIVIDVPNAYKARGKYFFEKFFEKIAADKDKTDITEEDFLSIGQKAKRIRANSSLTEEKKQTVKPLQFKKARPSQISTMINAANSGHFYLQKTLGRLPKQTRVNQNKDDRKIKSREEFFAVAGLPVGHTTNYWRFSGSNMEIYVPDNCRDQAEYFFRELFSQSYTRAKKGKDGNDKPLTKAWIEKIANDANEKLDSARKKEVSKDQTKKALNKEYKSAQDHILRNTYEGASERLLQIVTGMQSGRDWVIKTFDLREPTDSMKKEIAAIESSRGSKKDKKIQRHATILDPDAEQNELHYCCTDVNNERFAAFLVHLEEEVAKPGFRQSLWEDTFHKVLKKSSEFLGKQQKATTRKANIRSNKLKKTGADYLKINWIPALNKRDRGDFKRHFKWETDGHHHVLIPESPYGEALYDALNEISKVQLLKYVIGDGENGSFSVKEDGKQRKTIRLSQKIPYSENRLRIFEMWMNQVIQNIPGELSMENIESELKSEFRKIDKRIEKDREKRQKAVTEVEQKKEKMEEKRISFSDKKARQVLAQLNEDVVIQKKPEVRQKPIERLKEAFKIGTIRVTDQSIFIGGSSDKDYMTKKEQDIKGFIEHLRDNANTIDVKTCDFAKEFRSYQNKTWKDRYEILEFKGGNQYFEKDVVVRMRNAEQIETNKLLDTHALTYIVGSAGTGKTFVAAMKAIHDVLDKSSNIQEVLITRPVVPVDGQDDLGYLPGNVDEKMAEYVQSFRDNMEDIFGAEATELMMNGNSEKKVKPIIKIQAPQFIRGRSLKGKWLLVDEGQNMTKGYINVITTRPARDTKMAIMADITEGEGAQCDLPVHQRGALRHLIGTDLMIKDNKKNLVSSKKGGRATDDTAFIQLIDGERSEFVDNRVRLMEFKQQKASTMFTEEKVNEYLENILKKAEFKIK